MKGRAGRWMARLLPKELRAPYGQELVDVVTDRLREEREERGRRACLVFLVRAFTDFLATAVRSRIRRFSTHARIAWGGDASSRRKLPTGTGRRAPVRLLDEIRQDLRFGIRMLVKRPGLSLIVIVTFGLGIGLASTAFNITNGFVHKDLPFEEPDRILVLGQTAPAKNIQSIGVCS